MANQLARLLNKLGKEFKNNSTSILDCGMYHVLNLGIAAKLLGYKKIAERHVGSYNIAIPLKKPGRGNPIETNGLKLKGYVCLDNSNLLVEGHIADMAEIPYSNFLPPQTITLFLGI